MRSKKLLNALIAMSLFASGSAVAGPDAIEDIKPNKPLTCTKRSCMVVNDYKDTGWHEIHIVLGVKEPLYCYIRWENSVFVEKVVNVSKPYYLKPEYNPVLMSYRCDSENTCSHWMFERSLCKKNRRSV
jgi:hypothetical protein